MVYQDAAVAQTKALVVGRTGSNAFYFYPCYTQHWHNLRFYHLVRTVFFGYPMGIYKCLILLIAIKVRFLAQWHLMAPVKNQAP